MFQSTRETLKRHVVEFGDQLGKENEVALIVDGQVGTYSYRGLGDSDKICRVPTVQGKQGKLVKKKNPGKRREF